MRLIGRSKATEAGDEDEGASRGGLTASERANVSLARFAAVGGRMGLPEGTLRAEIGDEGAGNSLENPIERRARGADGRG